MLTYNDVQTLIANGLTAKGYSPLPVFHPGPGPDLDAQDVNPNSMVVIQLLAGLGESTDGAFDRASFQVRAIGPQGDYLSAETLARDIDQTCLTVVSSKSATGKWGLPIVRTGGAPALLLQDDGDRYHFICSYIWEVVYV
jgi:hypothetical protein